MSVPANDGSDRYVGNGVTTAYTYGFAIADQGQILVMQDEIILTLGTHYSVSGVGVTTGGAVTFFTAPAIGVAVSLLRRETNDQPTTRTINEAYAPLQVNRDFDHIVRITQMLAEEIYRALKFGKKSTFGNVMFPDLVADKFFKVTSGGNALELVDAADIATAPTVITLPISSANGGRGTGGRSVNVKEYGAVGNGIADDTTAIQAAIDAIEAAGGGEVQFDKGVFPFSAELIIDQDSVKLVGVGAGEFRQIQAQTRTAGTWLVWIGATDAARGITFAPVENAANHRLSGCGIEGIIIDGNELLSVGLTLKSLNLCRFEEMGIRGCKVSQQDMDVATTLAAPRDIQHCTFINTWFEADNQTVTTAKAMRLNGQATANTSFNSWYGTTITYRNGVGIDLINCDNNDFFNTHCMTLGTTGRSAIFRGSHVSVALTARNNRFWTFEPHTGEPLSEGTDVVTFPAQDNEIYGYTKANGAGNPDAGPNSRFHWTTERWSSKFGFNRACIVDDSANMETELDAQALIDTLRVVSASEAHIRLKNAVAEWLVNLMNTTGDFRISPTAGVWAKIDFAGKAEIPAAITDTQVALRVMRDLAGVETLQQVTQGAADSGGAGFRLLRVPN